MSTEKFVPISGLDNLTEEQKRTYYIQVCESFGLPEELNLLEYIWMDGGDGARKLVLWAKKGATDIWRDRHSISVKSLIKDDGDGYVMFTATGENDKKRQEMAVGAAETKGKNGKQLSDAVMTAQTRAIRRMTLQFVGGGFLDETEVQAQSVTTQLTSIPTAAVAPAPIAAPNSGKGTDITTRPDSVAFPKDARLFPTPEQLAAQDALKKVDPVRLAIAAGEDVPHLDTTVSQTSTPKKRRKRNTVDFNLGGIGPSQDDQQPAKEFQFQPDKTSAPEPAPEPVTSVPAPVTLAKEPDIKPDIAAGLSKEDKQRFDEKMKHYRNVVLPIPNSTNPATFTTAGGMEPTDSIGGVAIKLRRFAEMMFKISDLKTMTVVQWEQFFEYLDSKLEEDGAQELVKLIDSAVIGANK